MALKEDEQISHSRFQHDVDKATVTGAVFQEMQIQEDPLDADVAVRDS